MNVLFSNLGTNDKLENFEKSNQGSNQADCHAPSFTNLDSFWVCEWLPGIWNTKSKGILSRVEMVLRFTAKSSSNPGPMESFTVKSSPNPGPMESGF